MNTFVFFKSKIFKTIFVLSFPFLIISCHNQDNWYQFTSEENNFKIKFPDKPVVHDPSFRGSGNTTIKSDLYDYQDGDIYYKSSSSTYSENLINSPQQLDSVFSDLTKTILTENKGILLNKIKTKTKDHPGIELKIKLNNKDLIEVMRIFIMENNKVQINSASSYDSKSPKFDPEIKKNTEHFLNSFEVINEY